MRGKILDGRYELLEPLGIGGVGVVWRARRLRLDRFVAVKLLHASTLADDAFVRRFQREAVAMSRLYHPHVVGVIDFGVFDGGPYLVLEWVPGQTIAELVDRERFAPARAVAVALQVLETLAYFHERQVIHRDLKAENVMLAAGDFVKILDFGMAKILDHEDPQVSVMGVLPGTPSAMAPEQIRQLPPDPRIDLYATGILLFEMLVGNRPFRGADHAETLRLQMSAAPPRVSGISDELAAVIDKALRKDRTDRFASAAAMAEALRCTPEAQPRHRRSWLANGVAVLMAAASVAVATVRVTHPASTNAAMIAPPPPPPVTDPWQAHRDLAALYASRGKIGEALREVMAAARDLAPPAPPQRPKARRR